MLKFFLGMITGAVVLWVVFVIIGAIGAIRENVKLKEQLDKTNKDIVHCKNCYYNVSGVCVNSHFTKLVPFTSGMPIKEEYFCSYAEQRESK